MGLDGMQVSRSRLSIQVADQLKELIASRQLKPNDRLPAERELAEQLGISRSVLREAIKLLEQQGLLSVQVGRGTFVEQIDPKDVSVSFAESLNIMMRQIAQAQHYEYFYEIRHMIELEVARIAALRATESDIAKLEEHLDEMRRYHETDIERFTRADTDYHQALAQATNNPLFLTLLMSITRLLRHMQRRASGTPGGPLDAIYYHQRILEAVRNHDADASQQAMREHLENVFGRLSEINGDEDRQR